MRFLTLILLHSTFNFSGHVRKAKEERILEKGWRK